MVPKGISIAARAQEDLPAHRHQEKRRAEQAKRQRDIAEVEVMKERAHPWQESERDRTVSFFGKRRAFDVTRCNEDPVSPFGFGCVRSR